MNTNALLLLPASDASCSSTSLRSYQIDALNSCLFHNTLVVLPTGLGKTLIAATLLANVHRWHPSWRLVFAAPTKPLVQQQFDACLQTMRVPHNHMARLTGSDNVESRRKLWSERQIFFITPQILKNDCCNRIVDGSSFKCIIFDEAHKATGNHPYCQIIETISECHTDFRIIGLTASPGSSKASIQNIINNLRITKIEYRSEESLDVLPHIHNQNVEKIYVELSEEIKDIKAAFLRVCDHFVNALNSTGAYSVHNFSETSSFRLIQARESARKRLKNDASKSIIIPLMEMNFASLISLSYALQLLNIYGIGVFYKFLEKIKEGEAGGKSLGTRLFKLSAYRDIYQHSEKISVQSLKAPHLLHPKLSKLIEILENHFSHNSCKSEMQIDTRAIVFTNFRDSVEEIVRILNENSEIIRACAFTGQNKTSTKKKLKKSADSGPDMIFNQKQQQEVMEKFKNNEFNCLVSTCIGEEGFDIGEVDLIVCFEATKSPLRLIQRSGRTGRKRDGKIKMLLTKGIEDATQNASETKKKRLKDSISSNNLYKFPQNDTLNLLVQGGLANIKREYIFVDNMEQKVDCISTTANESETTEDHRNDDSCSSMFSDGSQLPEIQPRIEISEQLDENKNNIDKTDISQQSFISSDGFVENFLSDIIDNKTANCEEIISKDNEEACDENSSNRIESSQLIKDDPFDSFVDWSKVNFDETLVDKNESFKDQCDSKKDNNNHKKVSQIEIMPDIQSINFDSTFEEEAHKKGNMINDEQMTHYRDGRGFIEFEALSSQADTIGSKSGYGEDESKSNASYGDVSGSFIVDSQDAERNESIPSHAIPNTQQYVEAFIQNVPTSLLTSKPLRKLLQKQSEGIKIKEIEFESIDESQSPGDKLPKARKNNLPDSILESSDEYEDSFVVSDHGESSQDSRKLDCNPQMSKNIKITKKFLISPDNEDNINSHGKFVEESVKSPKVVEKKLEFSDDLTCSLSDEELIKISEDSRTRQQKQIFIDKQEGSRVSNICLLLKDKYGFELFNCVCQPAHYSFAHIVAILRINFSENLLKTPQKLLDSLKILTLYYKYVNIIFEMNSNSHIWDSLSINKMAFLCELHITKKCQVFYCTDRYKSAELINDMYGKFAEKYNHELNRLQTFKIIDKKFVEFLTEMCNINQPIAFHLVLKYSSICEILTQLKKCDYTVSKLIA